MHHIGTPLRIVQWGRTAWNLSVKEPTAFPGCSPSAFSQLPSRCQLTWRPGLCLGVLCNRCSTATGMTRSFRPVSGSGPLGNHGLWYWFLACWSSWLPPKGKRDCQRPQFICREFYSRKMFWGQKEKTVQRHNQSDCRGCGSIWLVVPPPLIGWTHVLHNLIGWKRKPIMFPSALRICFCASKRPWAYSSPRWPDWLWSWQTKSARRTGWSAPHHIPLHITSHESHESKWLAVQRLLPSSSLEARPASPSPLPP